MEKRTSKSNVPRSLRRPTSALQSKFANKFKHTSPNEIRIRDTQVTNRTLKMPVVFNKV